MVYSLVNHNECVAKLVCTIQYIDLDTTANLFCRWKSLKVRGQRDKTRREVQGSSKQFQWFFLAGHTVARVT